MVGISGTAVLYFLVFNWEKDCKGFSAVPDNPRDDEEEGNTMKAVACWPHRQIAIRARMEWSFVMFIINRNKIANTVILPRVIL